MLSNFFNRPNYCNLRQTFAICRGIVPDEYDGLRDSHAGHGLQLHWHPAVLQSTCPWCRTRSHPWKGFRCCLISQCHKMADVHQRRLPIFASFQRQNLQVELQHSSPLMRGLLHQIRAKLFYIVAGWNWVITITFKCHLCILKNCLHQATHTSCIIQDTHTNLVTTKIWKQYKCDKHVIMQTQSPPPEPMPLHWYPAVLQSTCPLCWKQYHPCKFIRRLRVQLVVSRQGKCPPMKASHFC